MDDIRGFAMRSIDDSREGVERFLRETRTPAWWRWRITELWEAFSAAMTEEEAAVHVCVHEDYRMRELARAWWFNV